MKSGFVRFCFFLLFVGGREIFLSFGKMVLFDIEFVLEVCLIIEMGFDLCIVQMIELLFQFMGYNLVCVCFLGQNGLMLQIMVECFDGMMIVEDCEQVFMVVLLVFDVEDLIDKVYYLEVFLFGIDWLLVCKFDFEKWVGYFLKCEILVIVDNCKCFCGKLVMVNDMGFIVECDQLGYGEELMVEIFYLVLFEVWLILIDDLICDVLKVDKDVKVVVCEVVNENEEF